MKRILYLAAIIISLLIINSLSRSIYDLWHKQDLVVKAESDLAREKSENEKLKKRLTYVKSNEFIETEARNKLFLVKPGESGVLMPEDLIAKKAKQKKEDPNWKQWVDLFVNP